MSALVESGYWLELAKCSRRHRISDLKLMPKIALPKNAIFAGGESETETAREDQLIPQLSHR